MIVSGYIVNQEGKPIPGATVQVVDLFTGQAMSEGTAATRIGYFYLDVPDYFSDVTIEVSSIGYKAVVIDPAKAGQNMRIVLQQKIQTLDPVVITTPAKKQFPVWALLPLLLLAQKKKRVSGINANTVLLIGGGVIGFSVLSGILEKLGIWQTKEERDRQKQYEESAGQVYAVQQPTKPVHEWKIIADLIYEDLRYSSFDDKTGDAGYQIARVQNDADVLKLAELFGERTETFFGIPVGNFNFYQFIRRNLSRSKLNEINGNYQRKGIKFRW